VHGIPPASFMRFMDFFKYAFQDLTEIQLTASALKWEQRWYGHRKDLEKSWKTIHGDLLFAIELQLMDLVYYYINLLRLAARPMAKSPMFQYLQFS